MKECASIMRKNIQPTKKAPQLLKFGGAIVQDLLSLQGPPTSRGTVSGRKSPLTRLAVKRKDLVEKDIIGRRAVGQAEVGGFLLSNQHPFDSDHQMRGAEVTGE